MANKTSPADGPAPPEKDSGCVVYIVGDGTIRVTRIDSEQAEALFGPTLGQRGNTPSRDDLVSQQKDSGCVVYIVGDGTIRVTRIDSEQAEDGPAPPKKDSGCVVYIGGDGTIKVTGIDSEQAQALFGPTLSQRGSTSSRDDLVSQQKDSGCVVYIGGDGTIRVTGIDSKQAQGDPVPPQKDSGCVMYIGGDGTIRVNRIDSEQAQGDPRPPKMDSGCVVYIGGDGTIRVTGINSEQAQDTNSHSNPDSRQEQASPTTKENTAIQINSLSGSDRDQNIVTGINSEQAQDNTDEKHFRSWLKFHLYSAIKLQGNSCSIHIVSSILFLMQVIKIILITSQLFSFGKDHGNFSDVVNRGHLTLRHLLLKDWDASWETLAYPPLKGDFAVYTIDDLENGINFAVKGYYNAKRDAIGFFQRTTDDTMVIQVKYFDFPVFNDTNVTQGVIIQDKTFSADVGLSLQNQTYNYDIIKELTGNGFEQPIKRMLSTELRFSIHSVRVYEKVRRARCLHVQGWVTFNDMDYNGQVIVNLETLTRRISCKQLNISAQDWALENTSKPLGAVLVFFCLLSMVASTLIIILTVYLCWKTKGYFNPPESTKEDLPVTQYLRLVNFWEIPVIISDILTLYGTIWIVFENEDSEWIVETLDFYSACLGIGCLFAWISILHFFKFHNKFHLLFRTFYRAFWGVFAYLICVTALFIGFWMCGFVVLGPYHVKFRTAQAAAETLFSMFNGDEIYATFANLETHKIGGKWIWLFSRFYIGTYIVTFTIVVVNLLIAIFISAYESITKNYEESRNERDLGQMEKALRDYIKVHSEEGNAIRSSINTFLVNHENNVTNETNPDKKKAANILHDQMLKLVNVIGNNLTVIEPVVPRTLRAFMNKEKDSLATIKCCGFKLSFLWKKEFGK